MRFVDLNNGEIFDGSRPYIHWLSDGVSTDLIYSSKLCVIGSKEMQISLNSDVFKLMVVSSNEVQKYSDVCKTEYNSAGKLVAGNYVHIIYISYSSNEPGEYHAELTIDDEVVEIAADFYAEDEELYINLSNFGVELPDDIQKAIYSSNIYECKKDNILLNRKLKELLSNYWDIIANKGSYKSLINSLKWFEWGDLIKIQEIWKKENFGTTIYDSRSLCSVVEDLYNEFYNEYSKTTYISLYLATQNILSKYDEELNPIVEDIKNITDIWTKDELMLKMCLLGNFYETYFMPIHLNLFHATLENIVFTNTIKIACGNNLKRSDNIYTGHEFECNVKDGSVYMLGNVQTQTGPDTIFGTQWEGQQEYSDVIVYGAETNTYDGEITTDNDLKTFWSQLYGGVGVVVPFKCQLNLQKDDYIHSSILMINGKTLKSSNITIAPEFNLLFTKVGTYDICMQYLSASSQLYVKKFSIEVVSPNSMALNVYKVKPLSNKDVETLMVNGRDSLPLYKQLEPNTLFSRNITSRTYTVHVQSSPSYKPTGVKNSHLLVLNGDWTNDYTINYHYWTELRGKYSDTGLKTVCISKTFNFHPQTSIQEFDRLYGNYIYKNEYTYVPKFHYLTPLDGDNEEDYWISSDTIVISAELPYGLEIDECSWIFTNICTNKTICLDNQQLAMVASDKPLDPGYYDVEFKYRMGDNVHKIYRKSLFRQL